MRFPLLGYRGHSTSCGRFCATGLALHNCFSVLRAQSLWELTLKGKLPFGGRYERRASGVKSGIGWRRGNTIQSQTNEH